jgi:hypothetical protein
MGREERRNRARRATIERLATAIGKEAADKGLLIEAGWLGLESMAYKHMEEGQRKELRAAFFAGAHQLFASIMNILEPGAEPTTKDLVRMELIHHELEAFLQHYKREHGVDDELIPPAAEGGPRN